MSEENVDTVRRMWAEYACGNFRASLEAYAENAVWDDTEFRPDGEVHVGTEALVKLVSVWREAWDANAYEMEVERLYEAPDGRVVAIMQERARGKGGGVELTNRWGLVTTLQGRKITHTMVYRTPQEALEAVGLSE